MEAGQGFPHPGYEAFIHSTHRQPWTAFSWVGSHLWPSLRSVCGVHLCPTKKGKHQTKYKSSRWTVCTETPASLTAAEPRGDREAPWGSETAGSLCADNSRCLRLSKNSLGAQSIAFFPSCPPDKLLEGEEKELDASKH